MIEPTEAQRIEVFDILSMLERNDEDMLSITSQVNLARPLAERDERIAELEAASGKIHASIEEIRAILRGSAEPA